MGEWYYIMGRLNLVFLEVNDEEIRHFLADVFKS